MNQYAPPIDDYRFLLERVLGFDAAMAELGRLDLDTDLAVSILEEAGRLCADQLEPLNRLGDEEGSRLNDGQVTTPRGFAAAYRSFVAGGWASLSGDPAFGGQGLPFLVQLWFDEMMSATNLSFGLFPGLTRGAAEALAAHGSAEIKAIFLPPMISGEWTGAMALTESGAGSDLALLRTQATPQDDGLFAITGTKIFISSGDHDFGGNIVHLVLARLPSAPEGVRGISLFAVPKFLPDPIGSLGERNTMGVGALEHKMGIHAQPTCVMHYDGAIGWLVGQPGQGLAAMFTMMNAERLMVGMQGLGIAGAAYQRATSYARERLQGRGPAGAGPVAIIEHPDVRRMLLEIRSFTEAARALSGWTALQLDRARLHPNPAERARSSDLVALLTPVIKAAFTDLGFESALQAQQVFGGHGYIRELGMEQFVRDARIAQIYEGTNGIQALDLVGRKLALGGGSVVANFLDQIATELDQIDQTLATTPTVAAMHSTLALLREATTLQQAGTDAMRAATAVYYLRLFALAVLGWMWVRIVAAAAGTPHEKPKQAIARFFAERLLPQTSGLFASITAGELSPDELPTEHL